MLGMFTAVSIIFLAACKKEGTDVTYNGNGAPPSLSATTSDTIALSNATKDDQAITFKWTNPDYTFSNGISSLNVTYNLEFDTTGANFSSLNKQTVQINSDLSMSYTVGELNSLVANGMQLTPGTSHNVDVRVVSQITPYTSGSASIASLTSNVLSFKLVPYAPPPVVAPPTSGELFVVGSATDGGWNNPVPTPSQQFTKIDNLHFTISVPMAGGQEYLFLPVNGDWSHKYACKDKTKQSVNGGDFRLDLGDNFPGPAVSGTYKIDVDFQKGKYTVTKQ